MLEAEAVGGTGWEGGSIGVDVLDDEAGEDVLWVAAGVSGVVNLRTKGPTR